MAMNKMVVKIPVRPSSSYKKLSSGFELFYRIHDV